jgi:hypothetical protein
VSTILRLLQPFSDLVRWGEPWDVEDDDPLFEADEPLNRWG